IVRIPIVCPMPAIGVPLGPTGSIAGRICVRAGGGSDRRPARMAAPAARSSKAHSRGDGSMSTERERKLMLVRFALILLPLFAGCLLWAFHLRGSPANSRPQPAATLPLAAPKKQQAAGATAQVPVGGGLDAITLSALPLSSIAAISPSDDPDP